ncbi:MAG: hypothetical protein H6818_08955 [Phycisphaerales bacterium]|nr:hypothetical protein [Phycisphaerales bacterium]MCB9862698.1 hypothetical protein [Phycisphaerales bacterium]
MNDRLIDILKQTDVDITSQPRFDDEARVADSAMADAMSRIRRRTAIGRSSAGLLIVMLLVGVGHVVQTRTTTTDRESLSNKAPNSAIAVDAIRREIEALDREAAVTAAVVSRIERREHSRNRFSRLARVEPAIDAQIAAETAAQTMLMQGDRLAGNELTHRLAPTAYRRVLELFPESAAAADARQRLSDASKGEKA